MKNIILESLDRFIEDGDTEQQIWEEIYNKINNDIKLNNKEIDYLNYCVRTCTFFKDFDYNKQTK